MCPVKSWDELTDTDKKILSLAGVTKSDVEEAYHNWYGTVYPYDLKIDDEWERFYLTQAELDEIYSTLRGFGCGIRNMGGRGKDKSELPVDALTRDNLIFDDFGVKITTVVEEVVEVDALKAISEKLIELENRIESLEGE